MLALFDKAAKFVPGAEASYLTGLRVLAENQYDISIAVLVKFGHSSQVGGVIFAVEQVSDPSFQPVGGLFQPFSPSRVSLIHVLYVHLAFSVLWVFFFALAV